MRKAIAVAVLILVVCVGLSVAIASAQVANEVVILGGSDEKPMVNARMVEDEVEIGVGGVMMFRIRASAVGYTPAERGRIVDARLVYALSYADIDPDSVMVYPVRGLPTIYIGNVRLITVYPSDAEAAGANTPEELANFWAASVACCLRSVAPWERVAEDM